MKIWLKLLVCWAAFGLSVAVMGILIRALGLRVNMPVDHSSAATRLLAAAMAGLLLVMGLWPVARGLAGLVWARVAALGMFLFLALGVNTIFDGAIYSTAFDGAIVSSTAYFFVLGLAVGCALGASFGETGIAPGLAARGWVGWAWRGAVAIAVWPFIYFFFGACIAPIVVPYYQNGAIPGLHLPTLPVIFGVQLVRSAIFLAATLPLISLWNGSRRGLWLALGLAHTVAVGLYGMAAATFLPAVLRITHSAEITCDSFAYAGLLALLFAAPKAKAESGAADGAPMTLTPHTSS